ncbi:MAG: hypothetical protein ABI581_07950, partial [Sediminibacterium sp.]
MKHHLIRMQALVLLLFSFQLSAQLNPASMQLFLENPSPGSVLSNVKAVKEFYKSNEYHTYWLKSDNINVRVLEKLINDAPNLGLASEEYQPELFEKRVTGSLSEKDSVSAEIRYTDAAIHFLHDVLMGNREDGLSYNGLHYTPSCYDIPALLNMYLGQSRLDYVLREMESQDKFYIAVKSKLITFREKKSVKNFTDETITKNAVTIN